MLVIVGFVKQVEYYLWSYEKMQRWNGFGICIEEGLSRRFVQVYELGVHHWRSLGMKFNELSHMIVITRKIRNMLISKR